MTIPAVNDASSKKTTRGAERLSLNDRLSMINLVEEGVRLGSSNSPIVADLFGDLWTLVDKTVSGSAIDRLRPEDSSNGFQMFEITSESGESLGRLNMIYLKKPIPCYYLVYVEVAPAFRNKGLGNQIVRAFRDLLVDKSAVGILDNIIPEDDPTFDIYRKLEWRPIDEVLKKNGEDANGVYMIFIPRSLRGRDLDQPLRKLLYHIKRKRAVIDMRENEQMVKRTIEEFKDLYTALTAYFEEELKTGQSHPLMCFMFTRFVTKLLGFRRRIGKLLGYTGGESLEQIVLDEDVRTLPIKSYAPRELAANPAFYSGDRALWLHLPEDLKKDPALTIESLPNYRRPRLLEWMEENGVESAESLTIGDLMELGFDPTRLKEITIDGEDFIFERVQPRLLPDLERNREIQERLAPVFAGKRLKNTWIKINPPLLIIRDRGNAYVLRKKVDGIHWEEAVEQLQTRPALAGLNASLRVDKMISTAVRRTSELVQAELAPGEEAALDSFSYFTAWDIEANQPKIAVDMAGSSPETVWIA